MNPLLLLTADDARDTAALAASGERALAPALSTTALYDCDGSKPPLERLHAMGRGAPVRASRLSVQVSLAGCEHDHVIPVDRNGPSYRVRVEGSRHAKVSSAGHVPLYDEPAQVAERIPDQTAASSIAA